MHGQQRWLPYPREDARGGSPNLAALAHGFGDNGQAVIALANAAPPVALASITVTPRISGKFKISTSVVVHNTDVASHRAQIFVGHAGATDYPTIAPSPVTVDANTGGGSPLPGAATLNLEVENGAAPYPFVAPLNVPVTFTVFGQASDAGTVGLSVGSQGAQIAVEELPN